MEIGYLVKKTENIVILWAVTKMIHVAREGANYGATSLGWKLIGQDNYFERRPREQSERPALLRATKYAETRFPGIKIEIH